MDPENQIPQPNASLWNTKQSDLTVGDGIKVGIGVSVVMTLTPFVVVGAIKGGQALWQWNKDRRAAKLVEEQPKKSPAKKA